MSQTTDRIGGRHPLALLQRATPLPWQIGAGLLSGIVALIVVHLLGRPGAAVWPPMPINLLVIAAAACGAGLYAGLAASAVILLYYVEHFVAAAPAPSAPDMDWLPLFALAAVAIAGMAGWLRETLGRMERELNGTQALLQGANRRLAAAVEAERLRSYYDHTTDLPTRRLVIDRFSQVVSQARRSDVQTALLVLDLNNFKEVNASAGHDGGDEVLRQIGQRLTGVMRREDTVGRLDSDTFAILLTGVTDEAAVTTAAQKVAEALEPPFPVGNPLRQVHVSASLGAAIFPQDGDDWEALYRFAEESMHLAKRPA